MDHVLLLADVSSVYINSGRYGQCYLGPLQLTSGRGYQGVLVWFVHVRFVLLARISVSQRPNGIACAFWDL